MAQPETVLMVVAPEAEALAGPFRERYDPSAALGAPAHITILYPFLRPDQIDVSVRARLSAVCAAQLPFDYRLTEIRRFDDDVLYLAPDLDLPFRELTLSICKLFPETPPYAGRHADIVPHLSVAWMRNAASLRQVECDFTAAAADHLPITARATSLVLFDNVAGRWEERHSFPFAA